MVRSVRCKHDPPDMAPVDVILVGVKNQHLAVAAERHMLYFEIARREQRRSPARHWHGKEMKPTIALPSKDDAVAGGPTQLLQRSYLAVSTACSFSRAPHVMRLTRRHLYHPNRPGQSSAMRLKEQ